jgi:hypothetical protein
VCNEHDLGGTAFRHARGRRVGEYRFAQHVKALDVEVLFQHYRPFPPLPGIACCVSGVSAVAADPPAARTARLERLVPARHVAGLATLHSAF